MPSVEHRQQKSLNNRVENSHQSTREREHRMRVFKSAVHAQRFLSTFGVIASFFRPGRHLLTARNYREIMRRRFTQWRELVGLQPQSDQQTWSILAPITSPSAFLTNLDDKLTKPTQ